jgi:signal transduction histidine kinase
VVAVLVLAVLYAPLAIPRANDPGPFSPWAWILMATSAAPLVWRRRYPTLCLLVVYGSLVGYDLADITQNVASQPVPWALLVAVYSLAWSRHRGYQVVVMVLIGATALVMSRSATTSVVGLITTTGAWVLGILAERRERRLTTLARLAGRMERERDLDMARAAETERARIARDMHDILAHAVSLMVVQAEAGPVVVRADPARAERAFDAIAGAGRDAMVQLRRMLGVLDGDGAADPRTPQPTIAALSGLVAHVGGTPGLVVDLRTSGEPQPLPADAEVAAYRIVQEALTNTVKHAAATRARVHLDWTGASLVITVDDDGRGGPHHGSGHGLIGIRARAKACGGTAEAGAQPGGYRVRAALPYAAALS